jgi:membrane-bound lytic murein transglycosylase B
VNCIEPLKGGTAVVMRNGANCVHAYRVGLIACGLALCSMSTYSQTDTPPTETFVTSTRTAKALKPHRPAKSATRVKAGQAKGDAYATRPEVMQIATDIAARRNLDLQWVSQAIGEAHYMPGIVKAILPPAVGVPKNWALYRSRFIDAVRIKAGVKFWSDNRETLERAEKETGVPAAIVVGIIGVETIYGQQTGDYRVMDALCTLAFDFPAAHPRASARAAYFQSELEEFLALTARTHTDPMALRGSYAGAMGLPQFMPSSWVKYAVDFDGDSRIDLFNSQADVIGSVANYFKAFNWRPGLATYYPVAFDLQKLDKAALLEPDILPTFTPADFAAKGAIVDAAGMQHPGLLALIELQNGADAPQYVAGTENFYAITRYNWSSYYAMAVIELGREVAAAMPK